MRWMICALVVAAGAAQAQPRVLVNGADSAGNLANVQTNLVGTGLFSAVDVSSPITATPTLTELLQYDAVILWTNSTPQNATAWGDVMADYVDAGGGVVVAVFANSTTTANRRLLGRWLAGNYEIVISAGGNTTGSASLGTILVPGNPIMSGVATFTGGTSMFRPTTVNVCGTCEKIALWSDGKTLVAIDHNRNNRADLGFFPVSQPANAQSWSTATDGARMMANALLYVASAGGGCEVDLNGDGTADFNDYLEFLNLYNANDLRVDFNSDGVIDFNDYLEFLNLYNIGC